MIVYRMAYHIRYTPNEYKENIKSFLDEVSKRYIVGRETHSKSGDMCTEHYHMYFESDYNEDTIRSKFLETMGIEKVGRGRTNKYYSMKKWGLNEIEYIIKQGDIVYRCNIDEASYQAAVIKNIKKNTNSASERSERVKKERKDEWGKLLEYFLEHKEERTITKWKQDICKYYLIGMRPVPRIGDLNRYAYSLNILFRSKFLMNEEQGNLLVAQYIDELDSK